MALLYIDFEAPEGSGLVSSGYPLLVFCKVDMEILSLFAFLFIVYYPLVHHFSYENRGNPNLWVVWIYIKEVFIIGEEYRIVDVVALKSFVYIFVFFPFISYHVDYTNMLYHYTEAILLYDFRHTFGNFYFYRAFVVSLVSVDAVSIFTLLVFIEVKSNISNVFSRFCVWVIYGVLVSSLLVTVLVLIPLGSLIVGNHNNVVFRGLSGDKLDRFRFLFVRVG